MGYYLQINGVNEAVYYATPGNITNLAVDEIIIDCEVTGRAAFDKYLSSSHMGFYQRNGSNQDQWSGNWTAIYINGVSKANLTDSVPLNQRITLRAVGTSTLNSAVFFFANNAAGSGSTAGKIYSVTVKNAGSTVAFYDMTLGNVQDQSGNGNHATLTGGTWVDDGAGGGVVEPVTNYFRKRNCMGLIF